MGHDPWHFVSCIAARGCGTLNNKSYPDEVVLAADRLKMLAVAFTGVVFVGLVELKVERQ